MADVRVGVLGPMVATVGGQPVDLGGTRQRAVLAALLLARQRMVPAERIIDLVWADAKTPALTTLYGYIKQLRRALDPGRSAGPTGELLARQGPGYVLRLGADNVDTERFAGLVALGARSMRQDDPAGALRRLDEALALWRGEPYAEFTGYAFVQPDVTRLTGLRLDAVEERYAALLALGEHVAVVGDLAGHVAGYPFRERGQELYALALYRAGRQREALDALRTARAVFADELGLDPGPALRQLETAVLRQDPGLAGPGGTATVTGSASATATATAERTRNVPFAVTRLLDRPGERAAVDRMLGQHRLVTLTGPGGVGKTTLALQVARGWPDRDGPWLVELAGLGAPELLVETVGAALGLPAVATLDQLAAVLGPRELLLVLDNCEHLVAPVATAVAALLARCGGLRVLATSREPLRVAGETVFEVPVLSGEQAAELFDQRAAAVAPDWAPGPDDQKKIRTICAELDRLPLAIELAAAHCQVLSVDQIAGGLDDRLALLADGPTGVPDRHRSLVDAVDWSYHLLDAPQQRAFRWLSVFASGFDLPAAEAVVGGQALAPVAALVRKSLVMVEPRTNPRRFRMLETLRQYAWSRLEPAELAAARAAHRDWVLRYAEDAERQVRGPGSGVALAGLAQRQAEIRAAFTSALAAGDGRYALRLGGALAMYWYRTGQIVEGTGWLRAAMAAAPDAEPGVRARALLGLGGLAYLAGDPATAGRSMREAVEAAREAGDTVTGTLALAYRALFEAVAGATAIPDAIQDAGSAVALARDAGEPAIEAEALSALGMLRRIAGQVDRARVDLAESVQVARRCGHGFVEVSSSWLAMKVALDLADPAGALAAGLSVLDLLERDSDVTSWLIIVHTGAAALAGLGRPLDGAALLAAVERHGSRYGFVPDMMDPVDAPRHLAVVRDALTGDQWAGARQRGSQLSRDGVNALLRAHAPWPGGPAARPAD
ncbi:BTAD domain-containing putative transcriptional regulator [Micromonospora sp. CPCC 206060]|uniref:AfsR/SARP family transcriptional regulator n=1 Tax=Micromonospora sp. CPCC 206060 TaxID=3122406 RepID=UPI002FEFE10D